MPLPDPFKVTLEDQVVLSIVGAVGISRKQVGIYDASTYRNTFATHQITVEPVDPVAAAGTTAWTVATATMQVPGSPGSPTVVDTNGSTFNTRVYLDDIASAVEPHPWLKIRTRVEFWDSADVGIATSMTAALVSGSATVIVSDNRLLTPGQKISGTGIPVGSTVVSLSLTNLTSIIISSKATATGDQTATFSGSNYVGGYWDDEELGGASDANILM